MRNYPIIFLFAVFVCFSAQAQQNNNWYFGTRAALDFTVTPGQPAPNSLTNSVMVADEGSASVSDSLGRLLFYTNGVTVYNRQHAVMLNGDNIGGNISACQAAIIIPVPGSDTLYYIFTSDAIENNFLHGYHYSIIDMSRDNGKGQVISKDVLLWASGTERLTAARHRNGIDVWLLTNDRDSDIFRAWLITCTGLQPMDVMSHAGIVLNQHIVTNTGYMKVSPDGKQLCQTHFPNSDPDIQTANFVQLFDFDNATGQVTNARSVAFGIAQYTACEYSGNSKLLYLTRPYEKLVDQLEATLPTNTQVAASTITMVTNAAVYALQLGPDEKIYAFKQQAALDVIKSPNIKGTGCNYQANQVILSSGSSKLGSPSSINDIGFDPDNGFGYTITDSCSGTVQFNGLTIMPPTVSWYWDFGDGTTSTLQNPVHVFNPINRAYTVSVRITSSASCGVIRRSRTILPTGIIAPLDFDYVVRCDSGYVRFINKSADSGSVNQVYTWYFGDGNTSGVFNPIHSYGTPGSYPVKLKLSTGTLCLDDSLIKTVSIINFVINVSPPDQTILIGQSVPLSTNQPAGSYQWTPPIWLNRDNIRNPVATPLEDITYKLTAANGEGCVAEDSVRIFVIQYDDIYVPNAFTPNNDGKNELIRPFFPGTIILKEFGVFNRWGQKVFSTSQRNAGWNGKINGIIQDAGVYVWIISAVDIKTGKNLERKGTFVMIR